MQTHNQQPKLGLALSGAAARSTFYIGFLEVLRESNIKVDYMVAQSGATLVATAFACGTMERLKSDLFSMDWSRARSLFLVRTKENGGLYSLEKAEEYGRRHWSLGKRFEDVSPKLCFIATDLETGQPVRLEMGDIAKAARVSCTVPGLFKPHLWGNRVLVDGGLVSLIPGEAARQSGADVVIGVNVRATKFIFPKGWLYFRSWYNWTRNRLIGDSMPSFWKSWTKALSDNFSQDFIEVLSGNSSAVSPRFFAILGKALDIAGESSKKVSRENSKYGCDLLVRSNDPNFGGTVRISDMKNLYQNGRQASEKALPEIKKLLFYDSRNS